VVPSGRVDKLIARRWLSVPPAYRSNFDTGWCRINRHLEETEGTERRKQVLKAVLYLTILVPEARGRTGLLGPLSLWFDHWMTSFVGRKVSYWEICKELAVGSVLVAFGKFEANVNLEVTYEVPDQDGEVK
jgi:hypothetical protein